jgi:putative FmdB family regulatory protein
MPIYEYVCGACKHHLEALQKMTESPLRKCPECGKSQLKRLVSASQFRLKGSGWYETDFKNKNETKRNLVEKGGAEASEAGTDNRRTNRPRKRRAKPLPKRKARAPPRSPRSRKRRRRPPRANPRRSPAPKPLAANAPPTWCRCYG